MPSFQSPRGTRDILPAEQAVWRHVRTVAEEIAFQMGYKPITTPTYEEIGLFQRAIGEGTDIQDKELFLVRGIQGEAGQEPYALRPEATAGIVRSYIEHGMHTWPGPVKLFTFSNNFRYDRPQKGRYREHVQFDIEYFGETGPFADAWIIFTTWRFLTKLGLTGLELRLNSLGSADERVAFVSALQDYYGPLQDQLSEDSKRRLSTNPLRILDSKDPKDHALRENAPRLSDMFGEESSSHFAEVQTLLEEWGIPKDSVILDPFLVRGLDYYSHTAFEWTVASEKGQQASLGGGGRYDSALTV
ncbi:MAG: histidine--tRNA ligase [Patescibacteria group bacterium]|nr:histidine--tRNA ligase [Patescibacteria group bacterium]